MSQRLYTYSVWIVRPGREEEFVAAWRELAEWTTANAAGVGPARLLQDERQPTRFISLAPWDSRRAIAAWRALPGYGERIARLRGLVETFTPAELDLRVEATAAPDGHRLAG
jgi:heme-degrading monooxygenase HmoA